MHSSLPEPNATQQSHSQQLSALIGEEIAQHGPMSFARFMECCLYAPGFGYYSAGSAKLGEQGDFITAPELGDVFAHCVAEHLQPVLAHLGENADIFELGGGRGTFAESVLKALAEHNTLPRRYLILEPSADLRARQKDYLLKALPDNLNERIVWLDRPPEEDWHGVLFANEVIDALPATRFTLRDGEVFEKHVVRNENGQFAFVDRPADALVSGAVRHIERYCEQPLADGYHSELLPQLPYWLDAITGTMVSGMMLFVDYGYPRHEYYMDERNRGTLRAHYRHHAHEDVFFWPGLQDLTASVDFTALAEAGEHAGFTLTSYLSQMKFLVSGKLDEVFARMHAQINDDRERYRLAREVKQLTLPGAMGENFQAMVLTRNLPDEAFLPRLLAMDERARL